MPESPVFARLLASLGNSAIALTPKLLEALSDLSPAEADTLAKVWPTLAVERRRSIVQQLIDFMDEDNIVSFEDMAKTILDDPDAQVRAGAIRLLWDNDEPRMAHSLLRILQHDPDPQPRAASAAALGSYIFLGELDELDADLKAQIEDSLLAAARDDANPLVQRKAVESLGFSSRPEVPPVLEAAYRHADPHWVVAALLAMGRSSDNRWEEHVLRALTHERPQVRLAAIETAGALALESARAALLGSLEEEDNPDTFRAAIWSLSQIGGEDVRPYFYSLLDAVQDDDENLADFIEEALENLTFTEGNLNLDFNLINYDPEDKPDDPR